MKRLLIAVAMAATLSGCAYNTPMTPETAQTLSNKDVAYCAMGVDVANAHGGKYDDFNTHYCNDEAIRRLKSGAMNPDDSEMYIAQAKMIVSQQYEHAVMNYENDQTAQRNENNITDGLLAGAVCNNNPVMCRAHMVNSTLNDAGW